MISRNKFKFIKGLKLKKNRIQSGCFVVEGEKIVDDLLQRDWEIVEIYALSDWLNRKSADLPIPPDRINEVDQETLKKLSSLTTPHRVLAIVKIPDHYEFPEIRANELVLALDEIQDPGNMGTIIRIASWFGIKNVLNSFGCVDIFNPKVVQASMSAIFDVRVFLVNLGEQLNQVRQNGSIVFGTFPEGDDVYTSALPPGGIILLGNESRGISPGLHPFIDHRISIPPASGNCMRSVESLNVATAAAIICSEFHRRKF